AGIEREEVRQHDATDIAVRTDFGAHAGLTDRLEVHSDSLVDRLIATSHRVVLRPRQRAVEPPRLLNVAADPLPSHEGLQEGAGFLCLTQELVSQRLPV